MNKKNEETLDQIETEIEESLEELFMPSEYIHSLDDVRSFLKQHPAMNDQLHLTDEDLEVYPEIFEFLCAHPDAECARLLLFSFPNLAHHGLCQNIGDILAALDEADSEHIIIDALSSDTPSVQEWAAQSIMNAPSTAFIPLLRDILCNPASLNSLIDWAVSGLESIRDDLDSADAAQVIIDDYENNEQWEPLRLSNKRYAEALELHGHKWAFSNALPKADEAFRKKNYSKVIELLNPYEDLLSEAHTLMLKLARRKQIT